MTVRVKICGLRDREGLSAALKAEADWVGFVFYAPSPRFINPRDAGSLLSSSGHAADRAVGLFVKPDDATIQYALDAAPLSILQIYDTPERAENIRQRFGRPVWLSVPVQARADLPQSPWCDGLVIEPKAPATATQPGGNGRRLDLTLLRDWVSPQDWLLAGGLTPDNVADAITASNAPAVDVSSGVESQPGVKSADLIARFVKAARSSCT